MIISEIVICMVVSVKTVAEYKNIRDERIQSWIDARFENGWRHMGADQSR